MNLDYKPPGAVAKAFMKDGSFVRGIRGPVGSGKSVTCCMEIMRKAIAQKPNDQKVRRSRWAVVRNTNPQLKTTQLKHGEIGLMMILVDLYGVLLILTIFVSLWVMLQR